MTLQQLPVELLDAICDAPVALIEQCFVRQQLRSTCKYFQDVLYERSGYGPADRAELWLRYGADAEFVLSRNLVASQGLLEVSIKSNRLDIIKSINLDSYPKSNGYYEASKYCDMAAQVGYVDILAHLHANRFLCSHNTYIAAAANGHVDCLIYMEQNVQHLGKHFAVIAAAEKGRLDCLIWLTKSYQDDNICSCVAKAGHLDCLQYLHLIGCPLNDSCINAAIENGNTNCLQYIHQNGVAMPTDACWRAAFNGNLDSLIYAHENGASWNELVTEAAAANNNLDCLRYCHDNGCPWDVKTTVAAATYDNLDCLIYAHMHGCPWDQTVVEAAAAEGNLRCLRYAHENGCYMDVSTCNTAITNNEPLCFAYACAHCMDRSDVCALALDYGNLACLQLARAAGYPMDFSSSCFDRSYEDKYIECLTWLHGKVPFDTVLCCILAKNHLKCLAYIHQTGAAWDSSVCAAAAAADNVQRLIYAHQAGCPWTESTCIAASQADSIACLAYAMRNKCPFSAKTSEAAAVSGSLRCLKWAYTHGCEWIHGDYQIHPNCTSYVASLISYT